MNLGEFHTLTEAALGRGTALTTVVPTFVRFAARWLERNYTFQYMKKFVTVSIDVDVATTPRYVELGPGAPKSIPMFRWVQSDGSYRNLRRVEPEDMDSLEEATALSPPETYWIDGVERIVLGATPTEDINGELRVDKYSVWSESLTSEHWLLDNAEDVLLGQTLVMMASRTRDPKLRETWLSIRDEGLRTLLLAEEELQHSNQDYRLEYIPSK